jgi:hypothetical protein
VCHLVMSQLILQRKKFMESDGCSDILDGVIIAIFIQVRNDNFVRSEIFTAVVMNSLCSGM